MNKLDGLVWRAVVFAALLIAGFTLQQQVGRVALTNPAVCTPGPDTWTDACQYAAEQAYRLEGVAMSMQWEYLTGKRW